MGNLKTLKLNNGLVLLACLAALASAPIASAQSKHHDWMDLRAAKRDLARLKADRKRALKYKNWGKVEQDDRLIAADKLWIMRDSHRVHHG